MSELTKLYNPANAAALTAQQIAGLQLLTDAELKELSLAYPNITTRTAYLLIIDSKKPLTKQVPTLSTFENLYNLHQMHNLKNYVALNFKGNYRPVSINVKSNAPREIIDLTDVELLTLPGFKTTDTVIPPSTVEVSKIKKVPKNSVAVSEKSDNTVVTEKLENDLL